MKTKIAQDGASRVIPEARVYDEVTGKENQYASDKREERRRFGQE
jgi:hypothetical protein